MKRPAIKTAKRVVPMIYAYTTPEIQRHNGWIKIGYTEQAPEERVNQQTHTVDVEKKIEWSGNAIFEDGSGDTFRDTDFHRYLKKLGVEYKKDTEWYHIDAARSRQLFFDFRSNRGVVESHTAIPYNLRAEQADAVRKTVDYFHLHERGEFLWNAKPRFGKTLTVYDFCRKIEARKILVVTNRPAIANSWYDDYEKFLGTDAHMFFVSEVDALKGRPHVLTPSQYVEAIMQPEYEGYGRIQFMSLQDLKGSKYLSGEGRYDKHEELSSFEWDVLVIDEAHEGVDTYRTDVVFDHINRRFTLHLSGTPFKALASDKFPEQAIFNWTYADEQKLKKEWDIAQGENPYATLPQLNMFTYQMSQIIRDELEQGIEIEGETKEYAFDLNDFFATNKAGTFIHDESVDRFLDALTLQSKFPFSTQELRDELKHTFWLLNRVDSAKALAKKLREHTVFSQYEVVLAAGDGKLDDADATAKSFDKVVQAIQTHDKTITLSVGQLTTGVTIPEWTAVLMLSNVKSPALYMQAAFRAQNPCLFFDGKRYYRKENAYVFDFDPARTLTVFEEFANDLSTHTTNGRGTVEERENNIRELLNFFPVIGEDENGEMIELDAAKVLSIPRKIHSQEVVNRGFMSDFLFQNISTVFRAPQAVVDILTKVEAAPNVSTKLPDKETASRINKTLDSDGDVTLDGEYVIGRAAEVFGDKIFEDSVVDVEKLLPPAEKLAENAKNESLQAIKDAFRSKAVTPILSSAQSEYADDIRPSDRRRLERKLSTDADRAVDKAFSDFTVRRNIVEQERQARLAAAPTHERAIINAAFDERQEQTAAEFKEKLTATMEEFVQNATQDIVKSVETNKREQEKRSIEDSIKEHLRGFSRTIPSFLMAYGSSETTLSNFDTIVPGAVFKEVTGITLEEFRFLRDGGPYIDPETGEQQFFEGNLFNQIVFDDSIQEFLRLRIELANYFDDSQTKDIFNYIPLQKTNQKFTPKWMVKLMVDALEEENPGCFDSPTKTFMDPYMKSGLYITEIVKRLYQSKELRRIYPDDRKRLQHIFAEQVYGCAPTEIIYRIAMNFIFGFASDFEVEKSHFQLCDTLVEAQQGTLKQKLEEIFNN